MEREHLRKNNPELVQKQDEEGNKGIRKILVIITLGVSAILGTVYFVDPNVKLSVDEFLQKAGILKK